MRLVAVLGWFLALVAHPALVAQASAAASPNLRSLEAQLSSLVASTPGDVGVAALDLKSGEIVSINGSEPFPMASTVKIAIAANYLAQVEHGRRTLNDTIRGQSAAKLMEAMIIRSDNYATDVLLADLGGPETVQAWLTQNKLSGLRIDRNIAQLLRAKRDLRDVRDSSTPEAMVQLLSRLDQGKLLNPWSRAHLLGLMSRCKTGKNRIRGMLPFGTQVENKTGTLNGLTTDVGYITLPNGRRIAVAFFARYGNDRPGAIARAARTIYDGFAAAFRNPFTGTFSAP
jgi:beta-lactamase class A